MTKYILHGGNTRESNEDNAGFFEEMTKGLSGKIRILLVYFAVEDNLVQEKYQEEIKQFSTSQQNLEFEIADSNKLKDQLINADVMYISGGSTAKLLDELSKTSELDKFVDGKTIAGSSAGAYAICKYSLSNESGQFRDGLGFLNIKCYCHFSEGEEENLKKLQKYKEDLSIITLPNYKWATIYR